MKRYDLRPLKENFYERMLELMEKDMKDKEVAIFLFEIGDFSAIQKSADLIKEAKYTLMNSIKFNEVDWTLVVKKEEMQVENIQTNEENQENKEESK